MPNHKPGEIQVAVMKFKAMVLFLYMVVLAARKSEPNMETVARILGPWRIRYPKPTKEPTIHATSETRRTIRP